MLRETKKNLQKELNRAVQENLNAKYNLESIKENKKIVEANLNNLKTTYNQLNMDKEKLNEEYILKEKLEKQCIEIEQNIKNKKNEEKRDNLSKKRI